MVTLGEKVEAELEQIEQALRALPAAHRLNKLSVLELAGAAALLSSFYHGVENILKQALLATGTALPTGSAWHRDLLQSACAHGIVSTEARDRPAPYMAFRHFFTRAYGFELDPQRLAPLVSEVRPVYASFKAETKRLAQAQAPSTRTAKPRRM